MTGFSEEQKRVAIWRDGGKCCLCGGKAEVANHRINRGMGGRPSLNILSNACALCHTCNDAIERDAELRRRALALGIKLLDGMTPAHEPYLSPFFGIRVWPRDDGDLTFDPPAEAVAPS